MGPPERRSPLFTLATGSKFLFITAATSSTALKDYFQPCPYFVGFNLVAARPQCPSFCLTETSFVLSPWLSTVRLLLLFFSGSEYAEDEASLKILSRVAAKFGKLESRRVQSHQLFEYSLLLSCLSFSLSLSLFLPPSTRRYLIVFIKTRHTFQINTGFMKMSEF